MDGLGSGFETTSIGGVERSNGISCYKGSNSSELTNKQKAFQWLGV